MFAELHWMKYQDKVDYQKAVTIYQILNNLTPSYLKGILPSHQMFIIEIRLSTETLSYIQKPNLELFSQLTVILWIQDMECHPRTYKTKYLCYLSLKLHNFNEYTPTEFSLYLYYLSLEYGSSCFKFWMFVVNCLMVLGVCLVLLTSMVELWTSRHGSMDSHGSDF